MIQIVNYAISYVYNCVYPCGEKDLKIVVNNDLHSQDAQIGLSITQNSLTFIKDDAAEIRTLITSNYDYYVNIDNLALFQLDMTNYEDDNIMVKVPLISSSVKDFLQNTTIETLGLAKNYNAHFLKKPRIAVTYHIQGKTTEMQPDNETSLNNCTPQVISGVLPQNVNTFSMKGDVFPLDGSIGYNDGVFLRRYIPIGSSDIISGYYNKKANGSIKLVSSSSATRIVKLLFHTTLYRYEFNDYEHPIFVQQWGSVVNLTLTENVEQNFTLTDQTTPIYLQIALPSPQTQPPTTSYSLDFGFVVEIENSNPQTKISAEIDCIYEIEGIFSTIDYTLQSVTLKSIYDACALKGISMPNEMNTNNLFITSPNIDKLNNTKVIDIVTFLARMQGKIINFTYDTCGLQPFSFIFSIIANIGNEYCKYSKKGFAQTYSYKIGKNPSKMRLANIPEGMWANTYSTAQNSNLLKQDRIDSEIIYDGAEILNILISNDQSVFIIDNSNNNIESDDDTPLNYNFAACVVAKKNLCRMVSNSQIGVTTYAPDDTAGTSYTIPNSGGLTTDQSQTYSGYRLAPYTEEMDIPFTGSIINYVLSLGFLCGLNVNGIDYIVESCEFGITPSQVHFVGRRVISA